MVCYFVFLMITVRFSPVLAIIEGTPCQSKQSFNHVVLIKTNHRHCTGSLISNRWIITSASCFVTDENKIVNSERVLVQAGTLVDYLSKEAAREEDFVPYHQTRKERFVDFIDFETYKKLSRDSKIMRQSQHRNRTSTTIKIPTTLSSTVARENYLDTTRKSSTVRAVSTALTPDSESAMRKTLFRNFILKGLLMRTSSKAKSTSAIITLSTKQKENVTTKSTTSIITLSTKQKEHVTSNTISTIKAIAFDDMLEKLFTTTKISLTIPDTQTTTRTGSRRNPDGLTTRNRFHYIRHRIMNDTVPAEFKAPALKSKVNLRTTLGSLRPSSGERASTTMNKTQLLLEFFKNRSSKPKSTTGPGNLIWTVANKMLQPTEEISGTQSLLALIWQNVEEDLKMYKYTRQVTQIDICPTFNPDARDSCDLALLLVDRPYVRSGQVNWLAIGNGPPPEEPFTSHLSGWGRMSTKGACDKRNKGGAAHESQVVTKSDDESRANDLVKNFVLDVQVLPPAYCPPSRKESHRQFCLMTADRGHPCEGDEGLPLVVNTGRLRRLVGVGHASLPIRVFRRRRSERKRRSSSCGASDRYYTFTNPCYYIDWIYQVIPDLVRNRHLCDYAM